MDFDKHREKWEQFEKPKIDHAGTTEVPNPKAADICILGFDTQKYKNPWANHHPIISDPDWKRKFAYRAVAEWDKGLDPEAKH